jgi:hypothetical protein
MILMIKSHFVIQKRLLNGNQSNRTWNKNFFTILAYLAILPQHRKTQAKKPRKKKVL